MFGILYTAITHLYIIDTLIQGRFDQLWVVIATFDFARASACDDSDGNYCQDDALKHARSDAFRLYSNSTSKRSENVLGRV